MDGYEYEKKCAILLKAKGFSNIAVTPGSGDQGIDIIAYKVGTKYGVQCKYYTGTVGNKAVQEAYAGAAYYGCVIAMVITNSTLSRSASALAKELNVEIWERVDAIYLQEHSKKASIDHALLTQAEQEDLQVEEIEAYLQEKYRDFHLKYPVDKNKDREIAEYADNMKRQVDDFESSFQRELDRLFSRIEYHTFRNWRDPALTPIKNEMRKCTKEFSGQLKRSMDEANRNAEHYLATKISVSSIIKLSDMIAHIFHIGDGIRVSFNASTSLETRDIAQFTWPEKYSRIAYKWQTIKKEIPSDPEEDDSRRERLERGFLQTKLNKATEKLEKAQESVRTAQEYIQSAPIDLAKKKSKLKDMEDGFSQKTEELREVYKSTEFTLTEKMNAANRRLAELDEAKRSEAEKLRNLFVLSFKKKEISRQRINDLGKDIEEAKAVCRNAEDELSSVRAAFQSDIQELENELSAFRKQIDGIAEKASQSEAIIKSKEPEIARLQSEIDTLKEQLKDFHKKYLLKNYRNIIKT